MTGVYVHIPFCKRRCNYCAFASSTDYSIVDEYVHALISEIQSSAGGECDTVYFGGGTPSSIKGGKLTRIASALKSKFSLSCNYEFTVEANPESCDEEFAEETLGLGANRFSLGLQSLDNAKLKSIGRLHDVDGYFKAVSTLKSYGATNISCDLIIGLEGLTIPDIKLAIDSVAADVNHISVYALQVEEGTPLYYGAYRPNDDEVANQYEFAVEHLHSLGFERYEISNFARAGCNSRHNFKYWRGEPYVGFGAAACGFDGDNRYKNIDSVREYIKGAPREIEHLTQEDKIEECIMLSLRTKEGINLNRLNALGYDLFTEKSEIINNLISRKLMQIDGNYLKLTNDAFYISNGIILELL